MSDTAAIGDEVIRASAFRTHSGKQIGRDCNVARFGQLIRQAANPIAQAEDFVNDHNSRSFVLDFGINEKRIDGAAAVFDLHPFLMARRLVHALFGPILFDSVEGKRRHVLVMIGAHLLS